MVPKVSKDVMKSVGIQIQREGGSYMNSKYQSLYDENINLLQYMVDMSDVFTMKAGENIHDSEFKRNLLGSYIAIYECIKQQAVCNELND